MSGASSHELQDCPIRTRVAFGLAVAENVIGALPQNSSSWAIARRCLDECWKWEEGEAIRARSIYDRFVEDLILTAKANSEGELASIHASVAAIYYLLREAFAQEVVMGITDIGQVRNDMAEVSEGTIDETIGYARKSGLFDEEWVIALSRRLRRDYCGSDPRELGESVPRDYCTRAH
jgi:hypothetical protein